MDPTGFGFDYSVTFLQEKYIGNNSRSRIILKSSIGQAYRPYKVCSLCYILSYGRIFFIHRSAARYKGNNTARAHLIECLCEKVVVYKEILLIVFLIYNLKLTERYVTYSNVKETIGKLRFLVSAYGYSVFLIKLSCNSARDTVKLYTVYLAFLHTFGEHTHKIADTAGRLKYISSLETHIFKRFIHRAYHCRRSIKSRQGRFLGGFIFFFRKQIF